MRCIKTKDTKAKFHPINHENKLDQSFDSSNEKKTALLSV